ncbi:MAG: hypothetical protein WDO18_14190 [Acidobacteriota bacterium]
MERWLVAVGMVEARRHVLGDLERGSAQLRDLIVDQGGDRRPVSRLRAGFGRRRNGGGKRPDFWFERHGCGRHGRNRAGCNSVRGGAVYGRSIGRRRGRCVIENLSQLVSTLRRSLRY